MSAYKNPSRIVISLDIILGDRTSLVGVQTEVNTLLGGLKLNNITNEVIKKYRLSPDASGVLITDVEPKSKAEKAGFLAGDIIIQIEDVEVKNFTNIETALKKYNDKHKRIYVNRYGQTIMFVIK